MAMTVSELQVKVTADTRDAESGLSALGTKIGGAGSALASLGGAAILGGIAAIAAGLTASVGAAATFESAMSGIKAVSGATGAEMDLLRDKALDLGAKTSFSATEAAEGISELVKAGVSIADVMGGGAAGALSLAAAGAIEVKDAAEITSNALNAFGLSGENAVHVADQIAGAANASAIDVNDFKFSLAAVGAVANTVGFSFEDTTAAIALLGNAGIKGSDAGTSLKTMFLNLQPQTEKQTGLFKELGLITADGANKFFDATGKVKSMSEVAGTLQEALKGQTQQQKLATLETIFGSDAIRAAAVFANEGAVGIDKMTESIGKITAAEVAAERLNNLKGSLEQLKGSLETAAIHIGTMLLPGIKSMVDSLTEGVNQGIDIIKRLPGAWEDVKSLFNEGSTDANLENLLMDLGLSEAMVVTVDDWLDRIGNSWRTMQDVLAGNWSPSNQIDPFVNSLGIAATAVRDFGTTISDALAKASAMGAWDNITSGFNNLRDAVVRAQSGFNDIGAALERARGPVGQTASAADVLAAAIKGAALSFQYVTLQIEGFIDIIGSGIAVVLDFVTAASRTGDALLKLQRGDIPGAVAALGDAKEAFGAGMTAAEEFRQRGLDRAADGARLMSDVVNVEMTATAAAVESNMGAANQAVAQGSSGWLQMMEANGAGVSAAAETGMQGVAVATESGMAQAVAAVETGGSQMALGADAAATGVVAAIEAQAPAAAAAAEAMGTGMAAGIETAAPQMAAAAETGASGAVAAVQGQTGAASSAGAAVGDSLGSGMQSGILAWAGRIASAAANLVSSAIAAARGPEGADARSPSKKTEKLGKDMAEGLEVGLSKSNLGAEMQAQIRDFINASRAYIPVAGEIKRVEDEIKSIRDKSQTDYLFRAKEMITIDSEALRLKQAQVGLERDLVPLRQDLARATREVTDIERGSLSDRTRLIGMDGERKALRLQEIELEKQLIGLDSGSKKAQSIQKQIDKLRDTSRALDLEAEKTRLTSDVAATSARIKRETLDDQARGQQTVIDRIKDQIEVLGAEQSVFQANENVIKNATDNEVRYRERLIAVFKSETTPLTDRIAAGLKLVDQLEKEEKISKDLATKLRDVAKEAGAGSEKTASMGNAAATAAPQLDTAAKRAAEMAEASRKIAEQANAAAGKVDALSKSLGKLPDWFKPKGGSSGSLFKFDASASGGSSYGGSTAIDGMSIVGASGDTVMPANVGASGGSSGAGATHTYIVRVVGPDDKTLAEWVARGGEMAADLGLRSRR